MNKRRVFIKDVSSGNECANLSWLDSYNELWGEHCIESSDSMPLGDGDTGLNVWATKNAINIYMGRSDTALHQKMGKLTITFSPNILLSEPDFSQSLVLKEAAIYIKGTGGTVKIWADANAALSETFSEIHIECAFSVPVSVNAEFELWRDYETLSCDKLNGYVPEKADAVVEDERRLIWLSHQKRKNCQALYFLGGLLEEINGNSERIKANTITVTPSYNCHLCAAVAGIDTKDTETFLQALSEKHIAYLKSGWELQYKAHLDWWKHFWNRSYVRISGGSYGEFITKRYILQRFVFACSSRGIFPSLYNGSIFRFATPKDAILAFSWVTENDTTPDERPWADVYMGQNTRHQFWPLLASGDYDLMEPLIRLVRGYLDSARKTCFETMGHRGACIPELFMSDKSDWPDIPEELPESTRLTRPEDSPEARDWHLRYHHLPGIEFTYMFANLYLHTKDKLFLEDVLLPCADEYIRFYDEHYSKKDEKGKRIIYPAGTAETYGKARSRAYDFPQQDDVKNPITEVSGLRSLISVMLSLSDAEIGAERRCIWQNLYNELPELPVKTILGTKLLAPGECYSPGLTCEASELYAVWPFNNISFLSDKQWLKIGLQSLFTRRLSLDGSNSYQYWDTGGWHPALLDAAVLGLPEESMSLLIKNYTDCMPIVATMQGVSYKDRPGTPRFPGFWRHAHMDGVPDQCHGGVCMNGLQHMLIQCQGEKIYLLPAWPDNTDVEFKLKAPDNTTIECSYKCGRIEKLNVTPKSREKDIIDCSSPDLRIKTLVLSACADENSLFNLPPMPDGIARPDDFSYRPSLAPWLEKYYESVCNIKSGPFSLNNQFGSVYRDNTVYLHVWDTSKIITLPLIAKELPKASVLTGGKAEMAIKGGSCELKLIDCTPDPHVIVKLTYKMPIAGFAGRSPYLSSLTLAARVSASSEMSEELCALRAVEPSAGTFWAKAEDDKTPWLMVEWGEEKLISHAELCLRLDEVRYDRMIPLEIQAEKDGKWQTAVKSQIYGEFWAQNIPEIKAKKVKLSINAPGVRFFGMS